VSPRSASATPKTGAEGYLPGSDRDLGSLREASSCCRGCGLYERATQTVFGVGDSPAQVMLVGEQPGDREDLEGLPFVGPAGRLLAQALAESGLDRSTSYVTNAVKHFKWEPRGKKRLHKKPSSREVAACSPWLFAEIDAVGPEILVCLGATAAQALLGRDFKVSVERGRVLEGPMQIPTLATLHPASVLRATDDRTRATQRERFVDDLRQAARFLAA
jgi:uracil-DNA glycosylase family protein